MALVHAVFCPKTAPEPAAAGGREEAAQQQSSSSSSKPAAAYRESERLEHFCCVLCDYYCKLHQSTPDSQREYDALLKGATKTIFFNSCCVLCDYSLL